MLKPTHIVLKEFKVSKEVVIAQLIIHKNALQIFVFYQVIHAH